MIEPPDIIWLQFHGDSEPEEGPVSSDDVTWCVDKIFEHDIGYVRAAAFRRTIDNMRLVASTWSGRKKESLLSFALEIERISDCQPAKRDEEVTA